MPDPPPTFSAHGGLPAPVPPGPSAFTGLLVRFAGELRAAGLAVGSGDVLLYCSALSTLDPSDLVDLYWAGRTTLVSRHDDIARYDEVFRRFFLGAEGPDSELMLMLRASSDAQGALAIPSVEPGEDEQQSDAVLGWMASDVDALKHKSFSACTPTELAALRRIMARIRLTPPRRRTRRSAAARSGTRPDPRRTVRESMRTHGEPARLYWRRRKVRLRPLILILDISGSMADYSRSLLQFAHSAKRSAGRVEVFCFGTRLTRVTGAMECRSPDDALERAAQAAFDWDGGTRIGDSLDVFVRGWARRGICRGGIVVICSDGLDRGDPAVLAAAMERLSRLSHRLVWLNPHKGDDPAFRPSTLGMMVAAPHIDLLLSGHDLASLEKLATLLPGLNLSKFSRGCAGEVERRDRGPGPQRADPGAGGRSGRRGRGDRRHRDRDRHEPVRRAADRGGRQPRRGHREGDRGVLAGGSQGPPAARPGGADRGNQRG